MSIEFLAANDVAPASFEEIGDWCARHGQPDWAGVKRHVQMRCLEAVANDPLLSGCVLFGGAMLCLVLGFPRECNDLDWLVPVAPQPLDEAETAGLTLRLQRIYEDHLTPTVAPWIDDSARVTELARTHLRSCPTIVDHELYDLPAPFKGRLRVVCPAWMIFEKTRSLLAPLTADRIRVRDLVDLYGLSLRMNEWRLDATSVARFGRQHLWGQTESPPRDLRKSRDRYADAYEAATIVQKPPFDVVWPVAVELTMQVDVALSKTGHA